MGTFGPKYGEAEFALRGEDIYEKLVLPTINPKSDDGKWVLIDIDSSDFEVDTHELAAAQRLRDRRPQAQVWMRRVGRKAARRFGGRVVSRS